MGWIWRGMSLVAGKQNSREGLTWSMLQMQRVGLWACGGVQ